MKLLSEAECLEKLRSRPQMPGPWLIYSSLIGGWTRSSMGALIGIDDHGFHRGDGVFEALRVKQGKVYLLESHWLRLEQSSKKIGITIPFDFKGLKEIIEAGLQNEPKADLILRLFVTRGPGGFSVSPQESLAPGFFAVLMPYKPYPEEKYQSGVRLGRSQVPMKAKWLAITKSLNYLPNVMMKQECLSRGLDFSLSFDVQGTVGECSTENLVLINRAGKLCHPPLDQILKGCTMQRLFDLVEAKQMLQVQRGAVMSEQDLISSQGAFLVGTTLDVLPVSQYEGHQIPIHPLAKELRELIRQDQI